jgi:hypothetical protein
LLLTSKLPGRLIMQHVSCNLLLIRRYENEVSDFFSEVPLAIRYLFCQCCRFTLKSTLVSSFIHPWYSIMYTLSISHFILIYIWWISHYKIKKLISPCKITYLSSSDILGRWWILIYKQSALISLHCFLIYIYIYIYCFLMCIYIYIALLCIYILLSYIYILLSYVYVYCFIIYIAYVYIYILLYYIYIAFLCIYMYIYIYMKAM